MSESVQAYHDICRLIANACEEHGRKQDAVTLVAVSKTFDSHEIQPILETGHHVFGENRVQEAKKKWQELKSQYEGVELHLIGPLQSNKAAEAVELFDVIETIDREKIAITLAKEMEKQNRPLPCYVQVNIGLEPQKAGIEPEKTVAFVEHCQKIHGLNIIGLMCIPPANTNPGPYFALMAKLADQAKLSHLSMGMSADFETAIAFGATSVRVGSAIFGHRL